MKRLLFLFLVIAVILFNFMTYKESMDEIKKEAEDKRSVIYGR